jgi:hypothetical protein
MLILFMLALPWMADPAASDQAVQRPKAIPVATCSRPPIQITQPPTVSALSPTEIADALTIATLLRRWERSVQDNPEWSRSQREEFRRRMQQQFNEQLIGHVKRDTLCKVYDWRIVDHSPEQICLEATPRDETERLFYGSVRVWLDAENAIPERIAIVSRNQVHRIAWQSENTRRHESIQLVHFEDDVPPSPRTLLRTANARVD